ncbi:MAG: CxxC-x17-CxxC domain-containing protein [Patescibacteria group bacterium]
MNNNNNGSKINFIGLTSFRNERKRFGIKPDDRRRHFYIIGKTGVGKSNLMENMAIQDIKMGHGISYIDPHGEGAEKLLDFVPSDRIKDVVLFNPADLDYPIAFNIMEKIDFKYRHLVAGGLMGVFKKVWPDVWSARMEYILNNAILALLEYPDSTLLGVNRMLADPEYRAKVVEKVKDPIVRAFWVTEYARYTQRYEIEATAAIQNKVGQFTSNALIRNTIGQVKSTIDMRKVMDEGKILILDLSKGRIGEDNSRLLGALLITKLQLAAMSRVDIPEEERKDFYLYVDEFQNFATESFANILSEARKYRLNLIVGHQYISQMEDEVRDAVFGNIGTIATFRVGAEDAEWLEREFSPEFTAEDLVNLPKYNVYLKLMIDGIASHPFSAETLPPPVPPEDSNRDKIIRASREKYSVKREIVEEKISKWTQGDEKNLPARGAQAGQMGKERPKGNFQKSADMKNQLISPRIQQEQPVLYDAICSNCGKRTKVIFPPEPGKPVYCKSCLKKLRNKNTEVKEKDSNVKIENIPFRSSKQKSVSEKLSSGQRMVKRKEINLSELKKALEDSLENKDDKEEKPEESEVAKVENNKNNKEDQASKKRVIQPGEKIKL